MNPYRDVRAFHEATGLVVNDEPFLTVDERLLTLREELHYEEYKECVEAFDEIRYGTADQVEEGFVKLADGICDLIYVLAGTAVSLGIPLEECWAEVQRSNMSKIPEDGVIKRREDGKILKPDTFSPPNLRKVIFDD